MNITDLFEKVDNFIFLKENGCPPGQHKHASVNGCHPIEQFHRDPRARKAAAHPYDSQNPDNKGKGIENPAEMMHQLRRAINDPRISQRDREFIASMIDFEKRNGYLTDKQWDNVERFLKQYTNGAFTAPDRFIQGALQRANHVNQSRHVPDPGNKIQQEKDELLQRLNDLDKLSKDNKIKVDPEDKKWLDAMIVASKRGQLSNKQLYVVKRLIDKYNYEMLDYAKQKFIDGVDAHAVMSQARNLLEPPSSFPQTQYYKELNKLWDENNIIEFINLQQAEHVGGINFSITSRVTFSDGKNTKRAVFKTNQDMYRAESVYQLAQIFGFENFPVTITKEFKGEIGSTMDYGEGYTVAYKYSNHGSEGVFQEILNNPISSKHAAQMSIMDCITGNVDRHTGNFMINESTGDLLAIDNDFAFKYGYNNIPDKTTLLFSCADPKDVKNTWLNINTPENRKKIAKVLYENQKKCTDLANKSQEHALNGYIINPITAGQDILITPEKSLSYVNEKMDKVDDYLRRYYTKNALNKFTSYSMVGGPVCHDRWMVDWDDI